MKMTNNDIWTNKTRKSFGVILAMTMVCLVLSGCEEEKVGPTVSFGTEDILKEGKVLGVIGEEKVEENSAKSSDSSSSEAPSENAKVTTSSEGLKKATQLDINDLPEDIMDMVSLCDTLNMTSVERGETYGNSPDYVWAAVHNAVMNDDFSIEGYTVHESVVETDPDIVKQMIRSMFGKVKSIPDIPAEMMREDGDGIPASISVGNDSMYSFSLGDRGDSQAEVRRATLYSDGSAEMEVALIGGELSEEIVSFIYSMRMNTKDTSASAKYDYEITGQRPANRETTNKMNGVPFITMVMQNYGTGLPGEAANHSVEEVPYFNSYNRGRATGIDALNARISYEIMEFAMAKEDEEQWHEIFTYPVSNLKYVQAVVTYSRWPDYGTEGSIRSYNFDVSGMKALDIRDACAFCDMSESQLIKDIKKAYVPGPDGGKLDRTEIEGFLIKEDGSVDFYAVLHINDTQDEPYNRIAAINSATKEFRWVFDSDEGVVSDELVDNFIPPLTHGK